MLDDVGFADYPGGSVRLDCDAIGRVFAAPAKKCGELQCPCSIQPRDESIGRSTVESRQRRKIRRAGLSRDIRATAGVDSNRERAVVRCAAEVRRIDDLQVGRIHLEDVRFDAVRSRPDWSRDVGRLCSAGEINEPRRVYRHRGDAIGQGAADVSASRDDVRVNEQWARGIMRRNYETNPTVFTHLVAGRQRYADPAEQSAPAAVSRLRSDRRFLRARLLLLRIENE